MILFPRHLHTQTPSLQDFMHQRKLGEGTYGSVSKYIHKKTLLPYAIKRMSYKNKRKSEVLMIQKQIQILYRIRNEYIVQLIDHFEDVSNSDIYLIMEYIDGGDLYKSIYNKKVVLEIGDVATIGYQICAALVELHANCVIHRDLKLQNVVYLPNKSIKLVDLGCSNYYGEDFQRLTKIGTKMYYSPQIILCEGQDDRLDVWCLGVLIYELMFMQSPFRNNDIQVKIKKLDYEIPMPYDKDQELVDMFKKIFCYKEKRIRAKQLIKHPWIIKNSRKQSANPHLDTLIFEQDQLANFKQFLLQEISKCQNDIERLKNENQRLKIKIVVQEDDDDSQDAF